MKILITLLLLAFMSPILGDHMKPDKRQYQSIATVDKRESTREPYLFYVVEYDKEAEIAIACNAPAESFTRRGCVLSYMMANGEIIYKVIVLSNDYEALRHELDHLIHGPCHVNAGGPTPIACQEWLIENELEPIGTQRITITKEEPNA